MQKFFLIAFILIMFIAGCSSNASNPVTPVNKPIDLLANSAEYCLLGTWNIDFDITNLLATVKHSRQIAAHYNVTTMLLPPEIVVNSFDPSTNVIDIDVTILNPFDIDGRDLRLIIYTDSFGHKLVNSDSWTSLYDIPGGLPINPFKAYATEETNRIFAGLSQHTENLQIYLPGGNPHVTIAIDVSYPSNCEEPYSIENFTQGMLCEPVGSETDVAIDVFDWQDDVDNVSLYCPVITGTTFVDFTQAGANRWELNLVNETGAYHGDYVGVIIASSEGATLYDVVTITIVEDCSTDWSFLVYVNETPDAQGAIKIDINEMEEVGSIEGDLNIIVLYDRHSTPNDCILEIAKDPDGFNLTIISPEIDDGGAVIPPGGLDMGDGQTLENFLRWSMENYPANKFALFTIAHGDGPFGVVPGDIPKFQCCSGLSIWEIRDACRTVLDENPDKDTIDLIGFNSCTMSYIELAYCLKDVSDVIIASEMPIPMSPDLVYDDFLRYLTQNIDCTLEEFVTVIVNTYIDIQVLDGWTLAAWWSDHMDSNVIPALNSFSQELINALPSYGTEIVNCRNEAGSWAEYCLNTNVTDIGAFADVVSNDTYLPETLQDAAFNLETAIEEAMIIHRHSGEETTGCPYAESGWQIWLPSNYNSSEWESERNDYISLGFSNTLWDDFLSAYAE